MLADHGHRHSLEAWVSPIVSRGIGRDYRILTRAWMMLMARRKIPTCLGEAVSSGLVKSGSFFWAFSQRTMVVQGARLQRDMDRA